MPSGQTMLKLSYLIFTSSFFRHITACILQCLYALGNGFCIFANKEYNMKAIEINSKTDKSGLLKINYKLNRADSNVRVLILLDDDAENDEEAIWMNSISNNPTFDFLKDSAEDIYSLKDGEPFID